MKRALPKNRNNNYKHKFCLFFGVKRFGSSIKDTLFFDPDIIPFARSFLLFDLGTSYNHHLKIYEKRIPEH